MLRNIRAVATEPTSAWSMGRIVMRALALSVVGGLWACSADQTATGPMRSMSAVSRTAASVGDSELIPGQYIVTFVDSVSDAPGLAKKLAAEAWVVTDLYYIVGAQGIRGEAVGSGGRRVGAQSADRAGRAGCALPTWTGQELS